MEQISRDLIKRLALENGFSLKLQPDNSMDLNPYVYDFAAKVAEHGARLHFAAGVQLLAEKFGTRVTPELLAEFANDYIPDERLKRCSCAKGIVQQTGCGLLVQFCPECGGSKHVRGAE